MSHARAWPLIRHAEDWRAIVTLDAYRGLIGFGLVALLLFGAGHGLLEVTMPDLFRLVSLAYLVQCALALVAALSRWPAMRLQIVAVSAIDVAFFPCLALASTGVAGGFGMLLLAPVAAAGMLLPARLAALMAACAALGMIGQETWRMLAYPGVSGEFVQAGILGTLFFLTAGLSHWLARRAHVSEELAAARADEVRGLASLNRRIIRQMQIGAVVIDNGRRLRLINDAAVALLDLEAAPRPGAPLAALAPTLVAALAQWRGSAREGTYTVRVRNRTLLPVFSRIGGESEGAILIFLEDATRQREQAQQLKLASIGRLTANIAHEIRNPLAAISHAGQLLAESGSLTADDRRMLDIIHRHARRIDGIVEAVMGLSRRSPTTRQRITLGDWLRRAVNDYRETDPTPPRVVVDDFDADVEVAFDPDHLRQVLFNLWDNAQRHARRDHAELVIELRGHYNRRGQFCLDVIDNGPGIDAAAIDAIMEPFYTTNREGSGLGLHIAGELCDANGASLLPIAGPAGACFRITFAQPGTGIMASATEGEIESSS